MNPNRLNSLDPNHPTLHVQPVHDIHTCIYIYTHVCTYVCHTKMCVYVFCYIQVPLKANVKQSLFQNRSNRALFKINRKSYKTNRKSIEKSMKINRKINRERHSKSIEKAIIKSSECSIRLHANRP